MLQAEATKLFEVERILDRVLQRKSLPATVATELRQAARLVNEAISYEDDEPRHVMTDDDL